MTREENKAEALRRLKEQLQAFAVEELVWDAGCNVPPYIRAAILDELHRRGISYAESIKAHGRGRPRGGRHR